MSMKRLIETDLRIHTFRNGDNDQGDRNNKDVHEREAILSRIAAEEGNQRVGIKT
jgi:hypothetical protein